MPFFSTYLLKILSLNTKSCIIVSSNQHNNNIKAAKRKETRRTKIHKCDNVVCALSSLLYHKPFGMKPTFSSSSCAWFLFTMQAYSTTQHYFLFRKLSENKKKECFLESYRDGNSMVRLTYCQQLLYHMHYSQNSFGYTMWCVGSPYRNIRRLILEKDSYFKNLFVISFK